MDSQLIRREMGNDIGERIKRTKAKRAKSKELKRGNLIIKDYLTWLHSGWMPLNGGQEVHHWMPKSRIKHNDYFVCCISSKEHYWVHHGGGSVNAFIEKHGLENLLMDSAIMFATWLGTDSAHRHRYFNEFRGMIEDISLKPTDFHHVLEVTRRVAEDIRLLKNGR